MPEEKKTARPAAVAPAPAKTKKADRIRELLTAAEEDIKALRLTSPRANNAWDKYQQVQALDPDNKEVRQGLVRIVESYIFLAEKDIDQGELGHAEKNLSKAETVIPGDKRIEAVRERIQVKKKALAQKEKGVIEKELPGQIVNSVGMKFVLCPAGSFIMGSRPTEGFKDERPARKVIFPKPFYIGRFEVSQLEYKRVMRLNPSRFRETTKDFQGELQRPVERVDWASANKFCLALSALEGKNYRLPTEAEWEYACRAGGEPLGPIGIQGAETHLVGRNPNAWGIYDMQGNVWEWCSDWYSPTYYASGDNVDPQGPSQGEHKVARGGSFISEDTAGGSTRSNQRSHFPPYLRDKTVGLRVVRDLD
ncbi:MAG: SUMF1/EgtB/PvdO family nonheme iron enzyme [Deltaproteobacteria bacterium]|nr:SUMF1/EgtB/PvdO family nonheme iron enzyme [Deltaproteobacteria bacterium]